MGTEHTEVAAEIDAPPAAVYAVFADYRHAHAQVLPKPYFSEFMVEQGGKGAGTVCRVSVTYMGQTTHYHLEVTEPEPGRVLRETDKQLGVVTDFIIDPLDGGKRSRVTLATDWTPRAGMAGWLDKLAMPSAMRKLYTIELQNLQEYLKKSQAQSAGGFA